MSQAATKPSDHADHKTESRHNGFRFCVDCGTLYVIQPDRMELDTGPGLESGSNV